MTWIGCREEWVWGIGEDGQPEPMDTDQPWYKASPTPRDVNPEAYVRDWTTDDILMAYYYESVAPTVLRLGTLFGGYQLSPDATEIVKEKVFLIRACINIHYNAQPSDFALFVRDIGDPEDIKGWIRGAIARCPTFDANIGQYLPDSVEEAFLYVLGRMYPFAVEVIK